MKKAHGKRMFSVFVLVFAVALSGSAALADFYVIAVGKRAKRTVLVSPQSTPAASGTALLNALNGITDSSLLNPYLIIIEPGVYDIGDDTLQMKYSVDIQGSGEDVTKITGNVDSNSSGVVQGEDNAELRFLTVENTGGGIHAFAIYNSSCSPRMTNVTARAYGGSHNFGVYNSDYSSPTMTNVTVEVWGGFNSRGVFNYDHSNPTMTNVNAWAYSGTFNYGVFNHSDSSPTMTNVTATASGGTTSYGVSNDASSKPTMTNVTARASEGTQNYGVYNYGSSEAKIDHSVISGSTNSVYTHTGSKAFIGNTRLEGGAVGGSGTNACAGVYDESYTFYPSACP